ncbi:MAG: hypothetical protein R3F40_02535 [Candidatus Competibacteraceae bacterium]
MDNAKAGLSISSPRAISNDPRIVRPPTTGGYGLDGQWSDDFHHALHTVLTGERHGYYEDFGALEQLAQVYRRPFVYAGLLSTPPALPWRQT